ncbi:hypothetical protein ABK040_002152 [Willaertia magna]
MNPTKTQATATTNNKQITSTNLFNQIQFNNFTCWSLLIVFLILHLAVFHHVVTKTCCSIVFLYIGLQRKSSENQTTFIALIFALLGDFLLAIPGGFMIGGFSFLLCHVFYSISFAKGFKKNYVSSNLISVIIPVVFAFAICYIFGYKQIIVNIKDRKYDLLVYPYFIIISIMASLSSSGNSLNPKELNFKSFLYKIFSSTQYANVNFTRVEKTYLSVVGSILFCISDIFVAREKFIVETPWNQIIGLPIYYIAQMFIAYSM